MRERQHGIGTIFFFVFLSISLLALPMVLRYSSIRTGLEAPQAKKIDLNWNLISKTNGSPDINLQEYQGKVIFLNLWAEWCGPCVEEMPSIQNLYAEYKGRVEFVTVVPEYTEATEEYIAETGYCFPVYEAHLPQSYGYEAFPTTWIIDREGNIAIHHIGNFKWDSQEVKDLLDTLL